MLQLVGIARCYLNFLMSVCKIVWMICVTSLGLDSLLQFTGEAAKARFKSLREKYVRERNAARGRSGSGVVPASTWHLLSAMKWLEFHLRTRSNTAGNFSVEQPVLNLVPESQVHSEADTAAEEAVTFFDLEDTWVECTTENLLDLPGAASSQSSASSSTASSAPVNAPSPSSLTTSSTASSASPLTQLGLHEVNRGARKKARSEDGDSQFQHTLLSLAEKISNRTLPQPDNFDIFGQMVASELRRCIDRQAVQRVKGQITALLFQLP